ncbi:hypothetical protein FLACHUCJ7_04143 [Flavobacterium chungangense]|uniref:Uncharacterized protein n=1 Tax=Flavobacterium chungangense TaxID=554283 RepID=A0A6V6ZC07_9FLAO|nr:hypothetical protein FLACHUCJ7_04143 [Flavobacterium chungangense]
MLISQMSSKLTIFACNLNLEYDEDNYTFLFLDNTI